MPYLTRRALEGLKAYKYKPAGYTYLDRVHAPFYECEQRAGALKRGSAQCSVGGRRRRRRRPLGPVPRRGRGRGVAALAGARHCSQCVAHGGYPPSAATLQQRRALPSGVEPPCHAALTLALLATVPPGCIDRLPMWLAPNLITLTGTIGLIIAYCVSAWYSPDFAGARGHSDVQRRRGVAQPAPRAVLVARPAQLRRSVSGRIHNILTPPPGARRSPAQYLPSPRRSAAAFIISLSPIQRTQTPRAGCFCSAPCQWWCTCTWTASTAARRAARTAARRWGSCSTTAATRSASTCCSPTSVLALACPARGHTASGTLG
jgi:hypothetical protein